MKKEQLCWFCQNAYANKCEWFYPNSTLPKFVKVDEKGFIVVCSHFIEDDEESSCFEEYTNTELAELLNISTREFYRKKRFYIEKLKKMNIKKKIIGK